MNSKITKLKNNLRIITSTRPEAETVSVGVWLKTGSAYEKKEANGISHFLEHMVFQGTKNRTALEISEAIENKGGSMNAYTAREFTSFYAKMLKDDLELAVDVLSDLITKATFPKKNLNKEKEVVIQEIKQAVDTPDDIIFDYMQEKAFPNQSIGRSILGPIENVKSFDKKSLDSYISTNYAGENMVICAVGNFDEKKFIKMVEKRLSGIQPKVKFKPEKQKYIGGFYAEKRPIKQAHIALSFEGVNYHDNKYYPSTLLSSILGGGMSSRLFQEIRDKRGLAYTVYSFNNIHTQSGMLGIYAGTGKGQVKDLMPVIYQEINKIRNEKVTPQELERAKTQLKAGMLMSFESSSSTAEIFARQTLIYDRVLPIKEMVELIESVTFDDIQDIAQLVFSSNPNYIIMGAIDSHPSYDKVIKGLK